MSGRAKRILYRTIELLLVLVAAAGVFFLFYGALKKQIFDSASVIAGCSVGFVLLLPFASVVLHELGHLLFGAAAGLRFCSFSVRFLQIGRGFRVRFRGNPDFAGETVMLPKNGKRVRGKLAVFAVGGSVLNFLYGILFTVFIFTLPQSPVLVMFEMLAPISLFEGLIALYPADLTAGRTDGLILLELIRNTPYALVLQSVLSAQGQLAEGSYSHLSRLAIFELPAIREDDRLFLSLTQLRFEYCYFHGEKAEALAQSGRLRALCDYFDDEELYFDVALGMALLGEGREQAAAFLSETGVNPSAFIRYVLTGEGKEEAIDEIGREPYAGIKELKEKMIADSELQA